MNILVAPIEQVVLGEKTFFSADEAVGQITLSVINAQGFSIGDFVILGIRGEEKAEVRRITSVATDLKAITVDTATDFEHQKNDTIVHIRYDKRKFYRSATKTGTFAHLTNEGSPVNIEVDNPEGTEFEDTSGGPSDFYKVTYFNSFLSTETSLVDADATQADGTEHHTSIFKIKEEAGFKNNPHIDIELVFRYRVEAEAQAEGAVVGKYQLPFAAQPKIFQQIVTLLSAGLLLSKEYGMEADVEISKTGQRKIERAEELLQKIRDDKILLIDVDGNELAKRTDVMASNSNKFDSSIEDRGEMFNLNDERFKLTDPADPLSDSRRTTVKDTGFT